MIKMNLLKEFFPVEGSQNEFYLEALVNICSSIDITLQGKTKNGLFLKVYFNESLAYRMIDEADLLAVGTGSFELVSKRSTFYTVKNSTFIEWYCKESEAKVSPQELTHYAIYTGNYCVDIISTKPPKSGWINKEEVEKLAQESYKIKED